MSNLEPLQPPPPVPPAQEPSTATAKAKKIPGFVWGTLIILSCAALACFAVALLLAPHWPPKGEGGNIRRTPDNASLLPGTHEHSRRPEHQQPQAKIPESIPEPTLPPRRTTLPGAAPVSATTTAAPDTSAITEYEATLADTALTTATASPSTPAPAPSPAPVAAINAPGRLAIVIDDMALDAPDSQHALNILPPPVTFAFLTYAPAARRMAEDAARTGHQVIVHIPMQPLPHQGVQLNPGPNTLLVTDDTPTLVRKLQANLAPLSGLAIGANNHMGSQFTQNAAGMAVVLQVLNEDKLLFLDSRTIARTGTAAAARASGFAQPLYTRDVFLDDTPTEDNVRAQLLAAVRQAQRNPARTVIAIGHPHPATLAVLGAMLPSLTSSTGVRLVKLHE